MNTRTLIYVAAAAFLLWLIFRKKSSAEQLAADVAHAQPTQVPQFGTDQIIDAADATAILELVPPAPPAPTDWQKYIGKIS